MAFLFGSIAATVASMSSKETYYQDQLENVSLNMKSIKLEEKLQNEVISYIELIQDNPSVNPKDMERFFKLLSPNLKMQTLMHVNKEIISKQGHFKNA